MKKYKITVQQEILVDFDESTEEFKDFFKAYNEYIASNSDHKDLAIHVATAIARYGVRDFIEGIGYPTFKGEKQTEWTENGLKEHDCLVNVEVDTDINGMVDFYVDDIQEVE